MRESYERHAMHRWPGLSQDGGDPQAQAEGHAATALAPVLQEGCRETYERERRQGPALRKRTEVREGGE